MMRYTGSATNLHLYYIHYTDDQRVDLIDDYPVPSTEFKDADTYCEMAESSCVEATLNSVVYYFDRSQEETVVEAEEGEEGEGEEGSEEGSDDSSGEGSTDAGDGSADAGSSGEESEGGSSAEEEAPAASSTSSSLSNSKKATSPIVSATETIYITLSQIDAS
mmetsp:Transcript_9710/g.14786  ORF Transcript_9710/g.14786 Transcript_9710/m.14786 type:complete len:163 (+) Transcript_9710:419-907(+)